jgi:SAM-dependent methyltransferase
VTRLVLLERGEELGDATVNVVRTAGALVALRLLEDSAPFREGQIVHVLPRSEGRIGARTIALCRRESGFQFVIGDGGESAGAVEVLGRVIAVQRGPATFPIERGVLARVPARWLAEAIDALEGLARFRHPLTPPLFMGSAAACLARVREKYGSAAEVRRYEPALGVGAEVFEREIVERHVKPSGRILDIGCGAGREAIGFARVGFSVVGIDIAPAMIAAARQAAAREGLAINFRVQSATDLDDPPRTWDGAFFSGSFQHIPGRALRIETLRRIARALTDDGPLILGVMYRGRLGLLSRTRVVDLLRALGTRLCGPGRFSEPGDGYMRDVSEASDSTVPVFFHDFSGPDEARAEIEAAGLQGHEESPGWWICRKTG